MRNVETEKLVEYACEDADLTLQLKPLLETELKENQLTELFEKIEMPLVEVLTSMELNGVKVDRNALDNYALELRKLIEKLEDEIYELAGERFLISSPKQLGIILFEKIKKLTDTKKTKTNNTRPTKNTCPTATQTNNRQTTRLQRIKSSSTHVETLPTLINPYGKDTHIIQPSSCINRQVKLS